MPTWVVASMPLEVLTFVNLAAGDVVINDGERRRRKAAKTGAPGRTAECEVDRLVAFNRAVVDDGHREGLAGLAVGEGQRAAGRGVVAAGRGRAAGRHIVDGDSPVTAARAGHGDDGRA